MSDLPIKILLVQDNPDYVGLLRKRIASEEKFSSDIEYAMTLRAGVERLARGGIDVILLELSLPDSQGINAFEKLQAYEPKVPIVILTNFEEERIALEAVQKGAQDYLLKAEVEGRLLPRVIRHAIERHRMRTRLMTLSLEDEVTGLYNRRGFFLLVEQQMKLAFRSKQELLLILMDIDGLKQINDKWGHMQGDLAISHTGKIICQTFRKSDIAARLGGDEFAVAAIAAKRENTDLLLNRMRSLVDAFNKQRKLSFELSLSIGTAFFDAREMVFLEQLLLRADEALYAAKKEKPSV